MRAALAWASDLAALRENFGRMELDALVVIGGDDTLGVALRLHNDFAMPVVGVPKTIDNDLMVTDFSFGFDTAVNIVTEAVDRLRTTTESHRRIVVVETMGRHSVWIA
jgi:6-phosphofructokinase